MSIQFSANPGAHERQLMRRHDNPLLAPGERAVNEAVLAQARQLDARDAQDFATRFRAVVEEATQLEANTNSERILDLRRRVDMIYERACTIAGDLTREKQALLRLYDVIDAAVRRGAGNDPLAHEELAEEAAARSAHLAMLEIPLVADLLRPDPPLDRNELVPTLLAADKAAFGAVIGLFDDGQKQELLLMMRQTATNLADATGVDERLAWLEAEITRSKNSLPS